MEICSRCGAKFDLANVKRKIGRLYGSNAYDDYYDDIVVCEDCAIEEISADYGVGGEINEDMDSGWDDD